MSAALESLKDILPESWAATKKRASNDVSMTDSNEADNNAQEDDEDNECEKDVDGEKLLDLPPRVIRPAHFDIAFEQVTATCSEDMASVQELRHWATKFSPENPAPLYMRAQHSSATAHAYDQALLGGCANVNPVGSVPMVMDSTYWGISGASEAICGASGPTSSIPSAPITLPTTGTANKRASEIVEDRPPKRKRDAQYMASA